MIVCLCQGINCSTVRQVIAEGASSVIEIDRACGAGGDCGACHAQLESLVDEQSSPVSGSPSHRLRVLPNRAA